MDSQQNDAENTLLDDTQAANLLKVSPRTLQYWRRINSGPPYATIGRFVRYKRAELLAWIDQRTTRPEPSAQ